VLPYSKFRQHKNKYVNSAVQKFFQLAYGATVAAPEEISHHNGKKVFSLHRRTQQ